MALVIKDRIKEVTTTTGTGTITLAGASTGFRSFADIGNANTTYYCISNNNEFEVGVGTYTASGTTLSRDTVLSNSLGTTAKINFSAGSKDVFCTYPASKAIQGYPSAGIPNSTGTAWQTSYSVIGTGNVILSNNPEFPTDITVNSLTVGLGNGQIETNTAYGFDAIGSSFMSPDSGNSNNVGIGYNALNGMGARVSALQLDNSGSGYDDAYDGAAVGLIYVSGTPIVAGGSYPVVTVSISSGQIIDIISVISGGFGWTAYDTVFTIDTTDIGGVGSGMLCTISGLEGARNNTALGYNAGTLQKTNRDSIYIGYNANGSSNNEIVIGTDVNGLGNNTAVIGNGSIVKTTLRGLISISGGISATGELTLAGTGTSNSSFHTNQTSGSLTIGGTSATGAITLGRSTGAQTVNIATGVNNLSAKTVNIGTGGTNGATTITVGPTGTGSGATTLNLGQNARTTGTTTVNIATAVTTSGISNINIGTIASGTTNIIIGSSTATSNTTINGTIAGIVKQQVYTVATLPTGSAGARSFVTNALAPTFGAAVVGGGAVGVPVYHDGTSWKVG